MVFSPGLWAFTIIERKVFTEGPFKFTLELQVYGSGSPKKTPMQISSVKVKIKNERASPKALGVKAVRAYTEPQVFRDLDTKGFTVNAGQWVTKYYRLPKEQRVPLGMQGFIQVVFEGFTISFRPKERTFQGPLK
jgi:hypothetical protein